MINKNTKNTEQSNFINRLKLRNFFPFYIENVNNKFFSTVDKTNRKVFQKNKFQKFINDLDKEEIEKFNDSQSILDHDNIQSLLNQIVWKIVAKTGNSKYDFFVYDGKTSYGHPQYVKEKYEFYDLKILGNKYTNKRYIYSIDVDKNSYLYEIAEQIQVAFFIDEKNKTITGGFSLNIGRERLLNSFDEIVKKIYLNTLLKAFIQKEVSPLSVNNFFSIIDIYSEPDLFSQNIKEKQNFKINTKPISALKKEWTDFLSEKIFSKKNDFIERKEFYENELFYSFLNVLLCCLTIYEELKKYFSSSEPELFLPLFKRVEYIKINDDQSIDQDFYELIDLLKNRYFHFGKDSRKNLKNLKSAEDAIEALIKFDQLENESFGTISTSFELVRNIDIPFLDEDDDIFMNSKELKIIFLLIFNPEILGLNFLSLDLLKYDSFIKNINEIDIDESWNLLLDELIDKTICEWNYDYVSFIDQHFSSLIIKNNNPIKVKNKEHNSLYEDDPNKRIYDNYLWSFIYTKTLMWKLTDIEANMQIDKIEKPWKLRGYLNELELLRLDWHGSFYGILQVKVIVKKIDSFFNFNSLNKILKQKLTKEDKLYGKGKERKNLAATFVSAGIFGLLDFFTTVFSILTVTNTDKPLSASNIAIIAIGTFFVLCLFGILSYKMLSPLFSKKKNKQYY